MAKLTDTDLMTWGKFKGTAMANVPASYLIWIKGNVTINAWNENVFLYIKENWDAIQLELKKETRSNMDKI